MAILMTPSLTPQTSTISYRASAASHAFPLGRLTLYTLPSPSEDLPVFIARNTPENRNALFSAHPPNSSLTPADLKRAHAFPQAEHRNHWLFSRVLLKTFLAQILDQTITKIHLQHSPLGKPHIADLSFSISHCQQYTALVFGSPERSLGIDIEQVCSPATAQSVRSFLHPDEQKQLALTRTGTTHHHVTRLWARKEAFLKALGTGLLREPSRDFLGPLATPRLPEVFTDGSLEHLTHPHITGHQLALCALPAKTLHDLHLEFKSKDL